MAISSREDQEHRFRELLRKARCRVTLARIAVLYLLVRAAKPTSVQQVAKRLERRGFDQVTVYRTLNTLSAAGVVRRIDFQRGHALYELHEEGDHHHVVCIKCERVADVQECCVEADMNKKALRQSGFTEITQHSLEFFGVCKACRG